MAGTSVTELPATSLVKVKEPEPEDEKETFPPITREFAMLRLLPSSCREPPLTWKTPRPSGPPTMAPAVTVVLAPNRIVPAFKVAPPVKSLSPTLMTNMPVPDLTRLGTVEAVRATAEPGSVVSLLTVMESAEIAVMTVPAGMPAPVTVMPTVKTEVSAMEVMTLVEPSIVPV